MQHIHFTTNRPRITGGFGPPPPCGVPEMVSFGTATALAATVPAQLCGAPVLAGVIDTSAEGPDLPLQADLQRRLAEAAGSGQLPLVIVPDRTAGFTASLLHTAELCAAIEAAQASLTVASLTVASLAVAPLMFGWPAVGGASPESLRADQDRAIASAHAYSRFLRAFAAARAASGSPHCLYIAVGMGALVSQAGGRALDAQGSALLPPDLFDRAMVLGDAPAPDVDQLGRMSASLATGKDLATLLAPRKRRRRR